jgi:hypothetical protein
MNADRRINRLEEQLRPTGPPALVNILVPYDRTVVNPETDEKRHVQGPIVESEYIMTDEFVYQDGRLIRIWHPQPEGANSILAESEVTR